MKTCWICNKSYDSLSKEHIIPRMFEGIVTTEEFSCEECNREIGRAEQHLAPLGILMANLDSADGEPKVTTPKRGSRTKERKMSYGDDPQVELSSTGWVRTEAFERPPGKITAEDKIWFPGRIPMEVAEQDLHISMVKAIAAFACHVGFPKNLLGAPLEYLAGNHDVLPDMQPTSLGMPPREMFARVWVFAPPKEPFIDIYGAVVYGPIVNVYKLCDKVEPAWPFCRELKAGTRGWVAHDGPTDYMNWKATVLEEAVPHSGFTYIGHDGIYSIKESRNSGLLVKEASPSASASKALGIPDIQIPLHPLVRTHGLNNRFENWARSIQSEATHSKFLAEARDVDEWMRAMSSSVAP